MKNCPNCKKINTFEIVVVILFLLKCFGIIKWSWLLVLAPLWIGLFIKTYFVVKLWIKTRKQSSK